MRKNIEDIKVKDLPKINEIWELDGSLIRIVNIYVLFQEGKWMVYYYNVNKEYKIFSVNISGHNVMKEGSLELGRFLHKATRSKVQPDKTLFGMIDTNEEPTLQDKLECLDYGQRRMVELYIKENFGI